MKYRLAIYNGKNVERSRLFEYNDNLIPEIESLLASLPKYESIWIEVLQ